MGTRHVRLHTDEVYVPIGKRPEGKQETIYELEREATLNK